MNSSLENQTPPGRWYNSSLETERSQRFVLLRQSSFLQDSWQRSISWLKNSAIPQIPANPFHDAARSRNFGLLCYSHSLYRRFSFDSFWVKVIVASVRSHQQDSLLWSSLDSGRKIAVGSCIRDRYFQVVSTHQESHAHLSFTKGQNSSESTAIISQRIFN